VASNAQGSEGREGKFMNPDVLITIAFVSLVVLVALVGGLYAGFEWRGGKDADSSRRRSRSSPFGARDKTAC
jgi:hypothetical protein